MRHRSFAAPAPAWRQCVLTCTSQSCWWRWKKCVDLIVILGHPKAQSKADGLRGISIHSHEKLKCEELTKKSQDPQQWWAGRNFHGMEAWRKGCLHLLAALPTSCQTSKGGTNDTSTMDKIWEISGDCFWNFWTSAKVHKFHSTWFLKLKTQEGRMPSSNLVNYEALAAQSGRWSVPQPAGPSIETPQQWHCMVTCSYNAGP